MGEIFGGRGGVGCGVDVGDFLHLGEDGGCYFRVAVADDGDGCAAAAVEDFAAVGEEEVAS